MYIVLAVALFMVVLTFCTEDAKRKLDEHNKIVAFAKESEQIEDLERKGKLPKLDRTNTLTGIDANNNGIRDDIETYIDNNYIPEIRPAVRQEARNIQKTLLIPPGDREAAREVSDEGSKSIRCLFLIGTHLEEQGKLNDGFDYVDELIKEIEAITTNTEKRLRAYLAYNKSLDGMVFGLPNGEINEVCDEETN